MSIFGCPLNQAYGRPKPSSTKKPEPVQSSSDDVQHETVTSKPIRPTSPLPQDSTLNDENYKYILESIQSLEKKYESTLKLTKQKLDDTTKELNEIKNKKMAEPFTNFSMNSQTNELLLFILLGMFLMILFDCMYKFGKKSF